jgi:hypothetical protein
VFNGREPDEHRWDFDFGAMDSVAGRVWFRPADGWEAQVSTGLLRDPEELTPGDAHRTTASLAWLKQRDRDFKAYRRLWRPYCTWRGVTAYSAKWRSSAAPIRVQLAELRQVETACS